MVRAALVLVAASLVLPAAPARAEGAILIDQGTVTPGGGQQHAYWHSKVLDPEVRYTIEVTGSMTEPYDATYTRTYDPLFCFGSSPQDNRCGEAGGAALRRPAVTFYAGPSNRTTSYDGIDDVHGDVGGMNRNADGIYVAQYAFTVVPGADDDYRFHAIGWMPSGCGPCVGEFRIRIFGPPVIRHGTVKATFLQKGPPKRRTQDLSTSSTAGTGTLRLIEALGPEPIAAARLVPKGGMTFIHSDTYEIADDEALILAVIGGDYVRRPDVEFVRLEVEVLQSTDPDCEEGSTGTVVATEPRSRRLSPKVITKICGHRHTYAIFKSGRGSVQVKIVRRGTATARANP